MATASIYGQYVAYADGQLLSENMQIEGTLEGDDQDVHTIVKGWAGWTPSPKKVMITLKNAISNQGIEFDAWQKALNSDVVELRLQSLGDGKSLTSSGGIRKPKISAGVGKNAESDWEFHGTAAGWI